MTPQEIDNMIDSLVMAGRTIEFYEDRRLRPLSQHDFLHYRNAYKTIYEARETFKKQSK